jgi:hypothetical protein
MAIVINRALRDGASTACFEVTNDSGGEEDITVIDTSALGGAGDNDNQAVIIQRVVATVAQAGNVGPNFVTLSWGNGTQFLHLPLGVTDINIPFTTPDAGGGNADVLVTASADTLFTLRIFVNKMTGYPLSMGHSKHRP